MAIQQAWETLRDAASRRKYDALLEGRRFCFSVFFSSSCGAQSLTHSPPGKLNSVYARGLVCAGQAKCGVVIEIDLDDMDYDSGDSTFATTCRCGSRVKASLEFSNVKRAHARPHVPVPGAIYIVYSFGGSNETDPRTKIFCLAKADHATHESKRGSGARNGGTQTVTREKRPLKKNLHLFF